MDRNFWAQAVGAFLYLIWEQALGKTRFGGTLGLAKAILWAIVKFPVQIALKLFKLGRKSP